MNAVASSSISAKPVMKMNANQQAAVECDKHAVVVAGPGTGKTRVLVEKCAHTYARHKQAKIAAVTFTRDAANELKERIGLKIGQVLLERTKIGTFHSLAISQLRAAGILGQIATPQNQSAYLLQVAKYVQIDGEPVTYEEVVMAVEKAKCTLTPDKDSLQHPAYIEYTKILKRNRMTDLYDVMRDVVIGMRNGTIQPMMSGSSPCTHLFVDEYQDSDEVQYEWVREHFKRGVITTVVCDDDQTIFEWRRALGYQGIEAFKKDTGAVEIVLGENYRCKAEILTPADTLIRNNRGSRIEKKLVAMRGDGGHVMLGQGGSQKEQAAWLVEQIIPYLKACDTETDGRFAYTTDEAAGITASITARNHASLHAIQIALNQQRIQCTRAGSGFWKQPYLIVLLGLLRSLQLGSTPGIDVTLSYLGVSSTGIEAIHHAFGSKLSGFLDRKKSVSVPDRKDSDIIDRFTLLTSAWRSQLREGGYRMVLLSVGQMFKDEKLYKVADEEKQDLLDEAINFLIGLGRFTIKTATGKRPMTLSERVDFVEESQKSKEKGGVALHTMHSCKGLEFKTVGLFNISQKVIPSEDRPDDINDRRLLYVGYTRAQDRLFISFKTGQRSKFLDESGLKPPKN